MHEIPSVTEYLLLKGASLHIDSIGIAIKDSNVGPDIIRNLLWHVADADVSSQLLTRSLGHHSSSQLLHDSNCLEIARALVDVGCERDVIDSAGYSPLIDLTITQSLPHVTWHFLQVGSPIHINHPVHVVLNSDVPVTPGQEQWVEQLHAWQTDCQFQTMQALIEARHDARINYLLGKLACGQLNFFCGNGLEKHNAEVIATLLRSSTPLHALIHTVFTGPVSIHDFCFSSNGMHGPFCKRDCGEMLLILIDEGFSVNTTDSLGDTPLHIAIQCQLFLIVEYLLRHDPICDVDDVITAFGTITKTPQCDDCPVLLAALKYFNADNQAFDPVSFYIVIGRVAKMEPSTNISLDDQNRESYYDLVGDVVRLIPIVKDGVSPLYTPYIEICGTVEHVNDLTNTFSIDAHQFHYWKKVEVDSIVFLGRPVIVKLLGSISGPSTSGTPGKPGLKFDFSQVPWPAKRQWTEGN
ncbi:hypothetical protein BDR05DRAFT_1005340 [Suillus weaverae]|nr:hypothetical protein BDR05DRAFT_1005340 [Suillus weaverae]